MKKVTFPVLGVILITFSQLLAQTQISGSVKGDDGEPLAAANIMVKGTSNGTMTDMEGNFSLKLEGTSGELMVTYIGYASETVSISDGQNTYDIVLDRDILGMNEVVVTGMVGERKQTMTPYSIATVSKEQLAVPSMSAESAIRGKVAGAKVVKGSGKPGSSASVQLRGATSINASGRSQSPLYIIDGVILSQSAAMADIDASDIRSIEVVKGAAGASLYGSRAAQGVVKIETARGQELGYNQTKVRFRSETGFNEFPKKVDYVRNHYWKQAESSFTDANGVSVTSGDYIDADGNWVDPRASSGRIPDEYAPGTGIYFQDNSYKYVETGRPGLANGQYDMYEQFVDALNGAYDSGESFVDVGNGVWDTTETFTDIGNGLWDEGEVWTDSNGNGTWDEGEPLTDIGNGTYDEGETFDDVGNGVWDSGESFTDALNGIYDSGESFTDSKNPTLLSGDGFDHFERFFDPGQYTVTSASISYNTPSTNFFTSVRNTREPGVIYNVEGNVRNSLRVNLDHSLGERLGFSASTYFSQSVSDETTFENYGWSNPFFDLMFIPSSIDLLLIDDTNYEHTSIPGATWTPSYDQVYILPDPMQRANENPIYSLIHRDVERVRNRFLTNLRLNYVPYPWLGLETNFSYDRSDQSLSDLIPKNYKNEWADQTSYGILNKYKEKTEALNGDVTASFNKNYTDLKVRSKLRYLYERDSFEYLRAEGWNFSVSDIPSLNATTTGKDVESTLEEIKSEGYFFISGFDFKDKYILDVLLRSDGSSLFGADERWQNYYRASFAYRLSEEPFWDGLRSTVNEFKVRLSQGTAGNRPRFNAQYETYAVDGGFISKQNLGNSKLKPEFSTETEFGIDGTVLDRYSFQFTYSNSKIEDQILLVPLSGFAGYESQWQNAGTLEGKTIEFSMRTLLMDTKDITWTGGFIYDQSTQKITEFDLPPYPWAPPGPYSGIKAFYNAEGEDLGTLYGNIVFTSVDQLELPDFVSANHFQVNDDGYIIWVGDANYTEGIANTLWGTSTTYYNADSSESASYSWGMPIVSSDKQVIGSTVPDFNYAFSTNFKFKRLSLYAMFEGQSGGSIYNLRRQWPMRDHFSPEVDQADKDDQNKKPTAYYDKLYNVAAPISHFVEDASYLKLQELSVSYRLPMSSFGMKDIVTVSFSGRNLWTLTDYSGLDPEVGIAGGNGGSSVLARYDGFTYPNFRTYALTLELDL